MPSVCLFTGAGGLTLGLHHVFQDMAFVEKDTFAQSILRARIASESKRVFRLLHTEKYCGWLQLPSYTCCCDVINSNTAVTASMLRMLEGHLDNCPIYDDVCTFPVEEYTGKARFLKAGFPCQGVTRCGKKAGLQDPRTGPICN